MNRVMDHVIVNWFNHTGIRAHRCIAWVHDFVAAMASLALYRDINPKHHSLDARECLA